MITVPEEKDKVTNFYEKRERMHETAQEGFSGNGESDFTSSPAHPYIEEAVFSENFNSNPQNFATEPKAANLFPHIDHTDEPVRDSAQQKRYQNMAKFNTLSRGLELLFGGAIAASGGPVPAPHDSGLTGLINEGMQNVDDKYYNDLAKFRDQSLRVDMFNNEQDARAAQAELAKMQADADRLWDTNQREEARNLETEIAGMRDRLARDKMAQDKILAETQFGIDEDRNRNYSANNTNDVVQHLNTRLSRENDYLETLLEDMENTTPEEIAAQKRNVQSISNELNRIQGINPNDIPTATTGHYQKEGDLMGLIGAEGGQQPTTSQEPQPISKEDQKVNDTANQMDLMIDDAFKAGQITEPQFKQILKAAKVLGGSEERLRELMKTNGVTIGEPKKEKKPVKRTDSLGNPISEAEHQERQKKYNERLGQISEFSETFLPTYSPGMPLYRTNALGDKTRIKYKNEPIAEAK